MAHVRPLRAAAKDTSHHAKRSFAGSALLTLFCLSGCTDGGHESGDVSAGGSGTNGGRAGSSGVGGASGTGAAGSAGAMSNGGTAGTDGNLGGAAGTGLGGAGSAGAAGASGAGNGGVSAGAGSGGIGGGGASAAGSAGIGGGPGGSSGAAGTAGGTPGGDFVEDSGADCSVPELPDSGSLPTVQLLPDPFEKLDGTAITSKSEWRCRRQEIKRQAEKYVYGEKPLKPDSVTGTVTETGITISVSHGGKSTSFDVTVDLPDSGSAPYPALISYGSGFFGFSHSGVVTGEGVAVIGFDPYSVGNEAGSRQNKTGAFYDIYGSDSDSGLLVAWAWGVSRIIDVIDEFGGEILKPKMAVAGCSRFGKGAFLAGVFDERMALTIPFESGTAGVPIFRGVPGEGAQSLGSAYGETYWFGDAFGDFTSNPTKVPVDTHEMVALIAPRGLLVLDNPHIANLGPRSAHVAALGGAEVYAALGVAENISYHSSVASGSHCEARPEHVQPLKDNLHKFLLDDGEAPGVITAASKATGDLDAWRDWTTPTLN